MELFRWRNTLEHAQSVCPAAGLPRQAQAFLQAGCCRNVEDFPASKGRRETLGKDASITTHTQFSEVMSVRSDPTSLCSSQGSLG